MDEKIPKSSINLIYADPPYNLSGKSLSLINNKTGGPFYKMNKDWDIWTEEEYVNFTHLWIQKAWDVLKSNGSLYVSCTYHNIGEVIVVAKKIGFRLNNILTWYKTNAMPSITKRTFTHSTEYVCWFVKGKNWVYNYDMLKELNPYKTKTGQKKQMRDFIEMPIVQGRERLKGSDGRAFHPTQKPEKLLELIITASSNKGDVILDPFFGTGTTGVVAQRLRRCWVGIEKDKDYAHIAEKRIKGYYD
ncbi:MAG TPA: site-specific DNA-methyltransferase [Anaerohalosphaeraceae bacterium]|nr:site-specific DNA-methyltransferase [Anaerohalosphaeraceae bacterium]HOT73549.1 site-specific DNA-methyltransferase [Anaerohalosphaeraceae bacterium]HQG05485.1 site-specific DNA-methyltransferase [Anaerohalosphaeraceae bacterium]HQI06858.1 site-specific DNA-methyltransferase [Anaerohalosphaeraceae bacterium]HQJ68556.1 site-specific DNA-methyltransferase [Anaerohalosphaeraceae bacterium]